jgi:26S proteasome regulatory subunit N12
MKHTSLLYNHFQFSGVGYAAKRDWNHGQDAMFTFSSDQQCEDLKFLPSAELAEQVIDYARELEMII